MVLASWACSTANQSGHSLRVGYSPPMETFWAKPPPSSHHLMDSTAERFNFRARSSSEFRKGIVSESPGLYPIGPFQVWNTWVKPPCRRVLLRHSHPNMG
ncbi:hypothetical protein AWENTII_009668 [Aspergillus wentii]